MGPIRSLCALGALLLSPLSVRAGVVTPIADLLAAKTAPDTAAAGGDIAYTLGVTNLGPDEAAGVSLGDALPAGLTFVSITQTGGPAFVCTDPGVGNNGTVSCTAATLAAGAGAEFTLVANIPADAAAGTSYTNIATVSGASSDPNEENNAAVAGTTLPAPQSDVGVQKNAPGSIGPDADLEYAITVFNGGPDDAVDLQLSDTLPGDLTFVSLQQTAGPTLNCTTPAIGSGGTVQCTAATFPAGASATFMLVGHVPASTPSGSEYTNTAQVVRSTPDPHEGNDASTVTTFVSAVDVAASKSGPASADAGTAITYTLGITNNGPDPVQGAMLQDALPPPLTFASITQTSGPAFFCDGPPADSNGTVSCINGNLAPGQSASFDLVVNVPASAPDGSVITNTAVAGAPAHFDTDASNDSASAQVTLASTADVDIAKNAPTTVNAGGDLTWNLTASNSGPDAAANVTITDTLPAGTAFVAIAADPGLSCSTPAVGSGGTVTCSTASLASGASLDIALTAHVPDDVPDGGSIDNTATIASAAPADPDGGDNSSTASTTVVNRADPGVSKTAPASIVAGNDLDYTLVVDNAGPVADGVMLTDVLPAGTAFVSLAQTSGPAFACTTPAVGAAGTVECSVASLGVGATAGFTLTVHVDAAVADGSSIANTASVTGTRPDTNAGNDSATASTQVINQADLAVSKTAPATVVAGNDLVYTLLVDNAGPVADGVTLTDVLPAGTTFVSLAQTSGPAFACTTPAVGAAGTVECSVASLGVGATAGFTLTVHVDAAVADSSSIANTASVAGTRPDTNAGNDSATASTQVINQADLAVTKTGPATANAGQELVYSIGLSNAGPRDAQQVSLTDALPSQVTFVSLSQGGTALDCSTPAVGSTGNVSCTTPAYANGASTTITLTVRVDDDVPSPVQISNTASVTQLAVDPDPANNSATTSTTASNNADLGVAKTAAATAAAGGMLAYTITANNAGPLADSATLSDTLPAGTTFVSLVQTSGPAFACSTPAVGAGGTVSCTLAAFASGASAGFTLTVAVPPSIADGSVIANTAGIEGARLDPDAANDSATASTTVGNQPNLALSKTGPAQVEPDAQIVYALDLANTGNSPALEVVLTDALPAQTRFVSLSQTAGPAFACTTPAVGAAGTVACTLPALAAGATARFALTVSLAPGAGGTITNSASATTTSADAAPGDNAAAAGTLIAFGAGTAPITIPVLSWFGLLALAAAIGLLGAAMMLRAR